MRTAAVPIYAWLSAALLAALAAPACAAALEVTVTGPDNEPVPGVAVYVLQAGRDAAAEPAAAVMDQRGKRFEPHLLIVQKGATVEFPNSDVVAHHVYSFSKPNNFVLPLYKGDPHDPVTFAHDGIVTLGCNIHDGMLGYIVVVDTDLFGVTGADGSLRVELDEQAGAATVSIWSPRIRDRHLSRVVSATTPAISFTLDKKLRPPHDSGSEALQWSDY